MGPSWYWMPEVFDRFFSQFNHTTSDFYKIIRLNPSYEIVWQDQDKWSLPASLRDLETLFENEEPGSVVQLRKFLKEAETKYTIAMRDMVNMPSVSWSEYLRWDLVKNLVKMDLFSSMESHINRYFKSEKIRQLLGFPVLFLGASASAIPALYSLMNHADLVGGTWYPEGGFGKIAAGMHQVALEQGVSFSFNTAVKEFRLKDNKICGVFTSTGEEITCDAVISAADYHHTEQLLPKQYRNYPADYWESRKMAPSCLLFYVGLNTKLPSTIQHHTLFFDADFKTHDEAIYQKADWPTDPLFYMCCPSKTDATVAPEGHENLFLLIPVASGLQGDTDEMKEKYFELLCDRIKQHTGMDIRNHVVYKSSFSRKNFEADYNSFKGNAYGLANTLLQTGKLKPSIINKHLDNLFYAGQLSVPGPGVPPSLISGEIVSSYLIKKLSATI